MSPSPDPHEFNRQLRERIRKLDEEQAKADAEWEARNEG